MEMTRWTRQDGEDEVEAGIETNETGLARTTVRGCGATEILDEYG
jgi:hypothetical protein